MGFPFVFTKEQQLELVGRFESGETIPALMIAYGCGRNRVTRELKELLGDRYEAAAKRVRSIVSQMNGRARKGKSNEHTPEWNAKIAASNRGKRLSDETKAKIGKASRAAAASRTPAQQAELYSKVVETKRARGTYREHGRRHSMWMHENAPMRGRKHTTETRTRMSNAKQAFFEAGGVPNRLGVQHSNESKTLMSEATSRQWAHGLFGYGDDSTMRSKLERRVFDAISLVSPDAVHSFSLCGQKRVCVFDVCIPSVRVLVEVNGDYWHLNPALYESTYHDESRDITAQELWNRDAVKKAIGESYGYRVVTFWECDLNTMTDEQVVQATLGSDMVNHG